MLNYSIKQGKILDFLETRRYYYVMEKHFLNQYCNTRFEWRATGVNIDNATDEQRQHLRNLKEKTLQQTGLTEKELLLIQKCRVHDITQKILSHARAILKNT